MLQSTSITRICPFTFKGCEKLKNITIPSNVNVIGDNAFDGCKSLEIIHISNNVVEIGNNAFKNCNNLREVVIDRGSKIKFSKWFSYELLVER